MLDFIKNNTVFRDKYKTNDQAVVISCFFNPQRSEYRTKAFNAFYDSIKHLNHRIIECVIGDAEPELPENENITRIHTDDLLWHKESLLNLVIKDLPSKYKYVFWVDADVLFSNPNWMVDGVRQLQSSTIIQPFEYCVHLEKDETQPSFSMDALHQTYLPNKINPSVWRSFAANYATSDLWRDHDYNNHGHVGFAWAARREVLDQVPLFDKALVGGADHIMAHAAVGQIPHPCITNAFGEQTDSINSWSAQFNRATRGQLGFVKGDLSHIWHGDVRQRDYLKRIQMFERNCAPHVSDEKGDDGLYTATDPVINAVMWHYYTTREVMDPDIAHPHIHDHLPALNEQFNAAGGQFGGAGATGSWEAENQSNGIETGGISSGEANAPENSQASSASYTPFS